MADEKVASAPAPAPPVPSVETGAPGTDPETPLPSAETKAAVSTPETPLTPIQELWTAFKTQGKGHPEIWGVSLTDPDKDVPSQVVFQKFLNANDGDLAKAKDQLVKTLEWRFANKPLDLLKRTFAKNKFDGVGYVTTYTPELSASPDDNSSPKEIFTWNIYGAVENWAQTFGDKDEYVTSSHPITHKRRPLPSQLIGFMDAQKC
jgi:hypothetical protein